MKKKSIVKILVILAFAIFPHLGVCETTPQRVELCRTVARSDGNFVCVNNPLSDAVKLDIASSGSYELNGKISIKSKPQRSAVERMWLPTTSFVRVSEFSGKNSVRNINFPDASRHISKRFNEIWLEARSQDVSCKIEDFLDVMRETEPESSVPLFNKQATDYKILSLSDEPATGLTPRSARYFLSRLAGIAPDNLWYYVYANGEQILQRRFELSLGARATLTLHDIADITNVTAKVSVNGNTPITLEFKNFYNNFRNKSTDPVLQLGKLVNIRLKGKVSVRSMVLKEVFIYRKVNLPLEVLQVSAPTLEIRSDDPAAIESEFLAIQLPIHINQESRDLGQIKFNLDSFDGTSEALLVAYNNFLSGFAAQLSKRSPQCVESFQWRSSMVRFSDVNLPVFVSDTQTMLDSLGTSKVGATEAGKFYTPSISHWYPIVGGQSDWNSQELAYSGPTSLKQTSGDMTVTVDGIAPRFERSDKSLRILGSSLKKVKIDLFVSRVLSNETQVVIRTKPDKARIGKWLLTVNFDDGEHHEYVLIPNIAVNLLNSQKLVQSIVLEFTDFDADRPEVTIEDVIIFRQQEKNIDDIFKTELLPVYRAYNPLPLIQKGVVTESSPGLIHFIPSNLTYSIFTTNFSPAVQRLSSFKVQVDSNNLARTSANILIKLNWDRGTTAHKLCLPCIIKKNELPINELLVKGMGDLKSVDWYVMSETPDSKLPLRISYEIKGLNLETPQQQLINWKPGIIDKHIVNFKPIQHNQNYFLNPQLQIWLATDIDISSVPGILDRELIVSQGPHPFFDLQSLSAQRLFNLSAPSWREMISRELRPLSTKMSQAWIAVFAIIILAWMLWTYRWKFTIQISRLCSVSRRFASEKVNSVINLLPQVFWAVLDVTAFALLTMTSVVYLVNIREIILICFLLLVHAITLQGFLWHVRGGWQLFVRFYNYRYLYVMAWAGVIGFLYLAFNNSAPEGGIKVGVLLLLSSLWASWPGWIGGLVFAWKRHPWALLTIFWTSTSVLFHMLAFVFKVQFNENYIFMIEAVPILISFYCGLRAFEVNLRRVKSNMASYVYRSDSALYYAAAILALACTAIFLVIGADRLARQMSVVIYFALSVGVLLEFFAKRKSDQTGQ